MGLPSVGFGRIESLTFPGGGRCVGVGVLGRCLVWRYFRACFVSDSGGFVGLHRFFSCGSLWFFFCLPPWALGAVPSLGLVLVFFWSSFGCVVLPLFPRLLLWFLFPLLSFLDYTSTGGVRSGSNLLDAVPTPGLVGLPFSFPNWR